MTRTVPLSYTESSIPQMMMLFPIHDWILQKYCTNVMNAKPLIYLTDHAVVSAQRMVGRDPWAVHTFRGEIMAQNPVPGISFGQKHPPQ